MGNYNPVYKSLWTSQKFMKLNPIEKLIYMYLITNEKVQKTGIYNISLKQIACDCELEILDIQKAIEKMSELKMITYWHDENLIYIYKLFKYSCGTVKNPDIQLKTIERQKELIVNEYAWNLFDVEFEEIINKLSMKQQSNKNIYNNRNNTKNKK